MATNEDGKSTQSMQYDKIGTKYNTIKTLPAAEPEEPSVVHALGNIEGMECLDLACGTGKTTHLLARLGASSVLSYDISSAMIDSAKATYPDPKLTFQVRDCSVPAQMEHSSPFDVVFAGWFLNYAGTEMELTNMFRVIEQNLKADGRFVGLTTNAHDPHLSQPKLDFYGLDILVLDPAYVAPDTGKEVGIKAKVVVKGETPFSFNVFQFRADVYERCAQKAGLKLSWCDLMLPDDGRAKEGYWKKYVDRPTFEVVAAVKIHQ